MQPPENRAAAFSVAICGPFRYNYRAGLSGATSAKEGTRMEKKAVYPGSLDPFTNGHMDIVRKASAIFDRVYIVMAVNSEKRAPLTAAACRRPWSARWRTAASVTARSASTTASSLSIEASRHRLYGPRAAQQHGLQLRGKHRRGQQAPSIRRWNMSTSRADNVAVSSSMVKELRHYGQDVSSYVPPAIAALLADGNTER